MKANTKFVVAGVAIVALLVAIGGFVIKYTASPAEAQSVEVRSSGTPVSKLSPDAARAAVSKQVGFEVKYPASVPDSLRLDGINAELGPEGVSNPLKMATLFYVPKDDAKRGSGVQISETGTRFQPAGGSQPFDLGVPGVDAYTASTDRATAYSVFTRDRGFLILVSGPDVPDVSALREMMASLVR
ncbi:MAG: hypothetical protein ABI305_00295 [Tepidiformaceae bacterium]